MSFLKLPLSSLLKSAMISCQSNAFQSTMRSHFIYKKIKDYSIELEFECFRNTLALSVGSIAKNVDDGFFIRTKSLHGSPPE
jgi:hypothetical protein